MSVKITIEGTEKEIADLVLAVQGQQTTKIHHNKTNIDGKSLEVVVSDSDTDNLIKNTVSSGKVVTT